MTRSNPEGAGLVDRNDRATCFPVEMMGRAPRQVRRGAPALLVLLAPAVAAAAGAPAEGAPLPHGWIGTTAQWVEGMGIAFALLNLVLLVVAWRTLRPSGLTPTARGWLVVAVGLVPAMVAFLTFAHGLESSSTVASCGFCHVMQPYVQDLQDPKSTTLAATHYKNRYIQERHCYTCHSDYGMAGTVRAKFGGVGHVLRYTTGTYTLPITIASPYPNVRCLGCHAGAQNFVNSPAHPKAMMPVLMDETTSCLVCHQPAHPKTQKAESR